MNITLVIIFFLVGFVALIILGFNYEETVKSPVWKGFLCSLFPTFWGLNIFLEGPERFWGSVIERESGLIIAIAGFTPLIIAIVYKKKLVEEKQMYICDQCSVEYPSNHVSIAICPDCNSDLRTETRKKCITKRSS